MSQLSLEQALDLAVEHHQAGRFREAEALYRQILDASPDFHDAWHLLGLLAHQTGHHPQAVILIGKAIQLDDSVAIYHSNLGAVHQAEGRAEAAIASFCRAIELNPDDPDGLNNLGAAVLEQGRIDEAVRLLKRALDLRPDSPDIYTNLGAALREAGRVDEAIACHRRALELSPRHAQGHVNLGAALHDPENPEPAIESYQRALALQPLSPEGLNNLGTALNDAGRAEEALSCFRQAVALKPAYAHAHWNLGLTCLKLGDFVTGWRECEWRWQVPKFPSPRRNFPQAQWDGSSLSGKAILVHGEQGFGDVLQMVRYVPKMARMGATVFVECQRESFRLLQCLLGANAIFSRGDRLPAFDLQVPVMSLPFAFGTTLESIPADVPYLQAQAASARLWRDRLGAEGIRVGIVWAGSSANRNNNVRSMQLATLLPLAAIPGVKLYSLQKDHDRPDPGVAAQMKIIDYTGELSDFADTAALIHNLHLVITIDSAVAHLAGAQGKPTWLMLPQVAEWRWMRYGEDSPWYPTMRLFRQTTRGDWTGVVSRVAGHLADAVAGRQPF